MAGSIHIEYNRDRFVIKVDGRIRGVNSSKKQAMRIEAESDFVIGNGYMGGMDSLLIAGVFEDEDDRIFLPTSILWVNPAGEAYENKSLGLFFRNRALDPTRHPDGKVLVRFKLDDPDGATRTIRISPTGEPSILAVGVDR